MKFCECISEKSFNSIFNHGLDDYCQASDLGGFYDYSEVANINIFNFYGPLYGDVNGFINEFLCANGYAEEGCDDNNDEVEEENNQADETDDGTSGNSS